jgi:hypothetical protein
VKVLFLLRGPTAIPAEAQARFPEHVRIVA